MFISQSLAPDTVTVFVPPLPGKDSSEGETLSEPLEPLGVVVVVVVEGSAPSCLMFTLNSKEPLFSLK